MILSQEAGVVYGIIENQIVVVGTMCSMSGFHELRVKIGE